MRTNGPGGETHYPALSEACKRGDAKWPSGSGVGRARENRNFEAEPQHCSGSAGAGRTAGKPKQFSPAVGSRGSNGKTNRWTGKTSPRPDAILSWLIGAAQCSTCIALMRLIFYAPFVPLHECAWFSLSLSFFHFFSRVCMHAAEDYLWWSASPARYQSRFQIVEFIKKRASSMNISRAVSASARADICEKVEIINQGGFY